MSSGFQLPGFQPDGFQSAKDTSEIHQTLPALTQEATAFVDETVDLPSEVLGKMFRFRPPRIDLLIAGQIHQTLPALTQEVTVSVTDDELVLLLL